jgi:hypothetical protein
MGPLRALLVLPDRRFPTRRTRGRPAATDRTARRVPLRARRPAGQRPNVRARCAQANRALVASRHGGYPHTDDGGAVRRVFHQLRSTAIESVIASFKATFDAHDPLPTRGLAATQRFALSAVLVYQLLFW